MKTAPTHFDTTFFENALNGVYQSVMRNIIRIGDRNPRLGRADMTYDFCSPSDWVSGFWSGQLWLAYKMSGEQVFKNSARLRRGYFQKLLDNPDWQDHDLGFQYILTSVAEYKLTGNPQAREMALKAADALLTRYRRIGKYIVAWNETHELGLAKTQGKTIIDSLQNVALFFWASQETGNPVYQEAAIGHADTLMKHIVREDYSTYHTFNFDPLTQLPVKGETFQGYADDSCWSRGQSWAVHGYAQIFAHSGDKKYLTLAKKLADYVIERLPEDGVPLWDYNLPASETQYRDSSAGAVTASGMLLIAEQCTDRDEAEYYRTWGQHMLAGLINQCDLTKNEKAMGLLDEGASFVKAGLCRSMLPYGDYYYMEALMRANGYTEFFW